MAQSISTSNRNATSMATDLVDEVLAPVRDELIKMVTEMLENGATPTSSASMERGIGRELREAGRQVMEKTVNSLEFKAMQRTVLFQGLIYRRLKKKTRNQHVATLFGTITIKRFPCRYHDDKHCPESCIFPLELSLGLIHGVTPALGSRIGKQIARTTQRHTLDWLREEHGVSMGAERLRKFTAKLSSLMGEHQHALQVSALLAALEEANRSSGSRKPVLAVGRDGVTVCENRHSFWEVATAATLTVFDRRGKRLLTIYLAHGPELGQSTISDQLTALITDLLEQWEGPLPRLAYIADSGSNETGYYKNVLRRMRHPRTGKPIEWQRVVDFYHAAERVWTAAEALFGKRTNRYIKWANRMLKLLKKPNGPSRMLHSAAAYAAKFKLGKKRKETLCKALNYIRQRTKWMQYAEYRSLQIPIGSGVTEAACKTIFTQRFKLSGMRWSKKGADVILSLRVTLLSGIWDDAYSKVLKQLEDEMPAPYEKDSKSSLKTAA